MKCRCRIGGDECSDRADRGGFCSYCESGHRWPPLLSSAIAAIWRATYRSSGRRWGR